MKIALIGNMNNNNFAIMRYFRDLGVDAHLLLYSNDGRGGSHFRPESDTWDIERWRPYIHQTNIPNAPVAAIDFPLSWFMAFRSLIRSWLGMQEDVAYPVTIKQLRRAYASYDKLVASGITPATGDRAGFQLDIFYPYSVGVEYLGSSEFLAQLNAGGVVKRRLFDLVRRRQSKGIASAKVVVTSGVEPTMRCLKENTVSPVKLLIPMVYNNDDAPEFAPTKILGDICEIIDRSAFTILHHARLFWRMPDSYTEEAWGVENKNNDWLIRAFAEFVGRRLNVNPILFIVEYGPDIELTKRLAVELGVSNRIYWLPKMDRRELMWLLAHVSVGVGEFYSVPRMIWGGTGWETLACGKPLLQGFNFMPHEFEQIYGYPPPPMLPVRKREDILSHLLDMADSIERREQMGRGAKEWFSQYNGIGLAKQWLNLLMSSPVKVTALKFPENKSVCA